MARAFAHLRILDLSWGMAGPMTTMFLADNGADVIRIEPPLGDPFAQQTGYRVWNRGKRSALPRSAELRGAAAFDQLARASDVVVDSFSLGTTDGSGSTTTPSADSIPDHHLFDHRLRGPPRPP